METQKTQLLLFPKYRPPLPTDTWAEIRATRVLDAVRALADLIPFLKSPQTRNAKRLRGGRTVPLEFIRTMIAAAAQLPEARRLTKTFDPDDAKLWLQARERLYQPVGTNLGGLLQSMNYTMEEWRATVARKALAMFAVFKGLARKDASPELVHWIEALTRDLGRKGTKKKKSATKKKTKKGQP